MNSQTYEPLQNLSLKKSNEMVSAKYKSTLLENQVMAIALTRIEVKANDPSAPLEAKLYPGELKKLIGDPAHIYRTLKTVSKTMVGHTMFMEDQKGNFKAHAIVTDATYESGVFTVKFNENLREHILGLERNYTTLELSVLTDFKRNSSFRIYELLKKEFYKSNPKKDAGRVDVEYQLSEFRFMIGIANADDPGVKNEMARMGNNIDWDVLYDKLDKKDRKYEKWYELVRNVIVPAQEELAAKSNIRFEYEGIRSGRKIERVLFSVYPNDAANSSHSKERQKIINENKAKQKFAIEQSADNRQLEIPLDNYPEFYKEFVGHNELTKEDIDLLMIKSQYNPERIRKAVEMADETSKKTFINNYMGWLIRCLEENWAEVPVVEGSASRGHAVVDVVDSYNKSDKESLAERAWQRIKKKEEFTDFVYAIESEGMNIEQMEVIYSHKELVDAFTGFRLGKGITIE